MQKYFILSAILITFLSAGQSKFGTVLYGKIMNKELVSHGDADMKAWFNKQHETANKIDYTLNFNQNEAYFFANAKLLNDGEDFGLAAITGDGKLKQYQNSSTNECRLYVDSRRTGVVIVNDEHTLQWVLTTETKVIDGFVCYKATTPKYDSGKISEYVIVTAWYAPSLPISFGPIGYSGLPGLVLELQTDRATYFVKKISLNLDKEPFIDKLLNSKAVTHKVLLQMLMGTLSADQQDAIKENEGKETKKN